MNLIKLILFPPQGGATVRHTCQVCIVFKRHRIGSRAADKKSELKQHSVDAHSLNKEMHKVFIPTELLLPFVISTCADIFKVLPAGARGRGRGVAAELQPKDQSAGEPLEVLKAHNCRTCRVRVVVL